MNDQDTTMTAGSTAADASLRFQHFEVLTKPDGTPFVLGRGAMGVTYKAFDRNLHSIVVIKVIQPRHTDDPTARRRFLKEAQAMARIRHPNVANIFHYGETDEGVFCALEFCEGPTLEEYLRDGNRLAVTDALLLCRQAADALQALEREDLVHRDIKPANIILTEDVRKTTQLKLIDFGLAKARGAEFDPDPDLTRSGFVGTPSFASPEQLLERTDLDIRSDMYSLGVTLWAMLTGSPVFRGSYMEVMFHHINSEPAWDQLPAVPESVRDLLARLLAKAPDDRFASATELWEAIGECLELEGLAEPGAAPRLAPLATARQPRGSIVGRSNYEILNEVGDVREGRLFRARDAVSGQVVALRFLGAEITSKPALVRKLRQQVARLQSLAHENFVNVLDSVEREGDFQLITEWVHGAPLLDLLKTRERLVLAEGAPLLLQLARVLDHAIEHAIPRCETEVHQIRIEFAQDADGGSADGIVRSPLSEWGDFRIRVNPLGITLNPDDYPGEAAGNEGDRRTRERLFVDFLTLTHRLLGGVGGSQTHPDSDYTTVPGLRAEANEVLEHYSLESGAPEHLPCQQVLTELLAAEGVDFSFEILSTTAPTLQMGVDRGSMAAAGADDNDEDAVSASGTLIVDPLQTVADNGGNRGRPAGPGGSQPSGRTRAGSRAPDGAGEHLAKRTAGTAGGSSAATSSGSDGISRIGQQRLELERKRLTLDAEAERLQHMEGLEAERAMLAEERHLLEEQRETLRQRDLERARAAETERRKLAEERRSLEQRSGEIESKRKEGEQLVEEMRLRSQLEFQKVQEEREELEREWEQRRIKTERLLQEKEEQFLVREQRSHKAVREERERLQSMSEQLEAAAAAAEPPKDVGAPAGDGADSAAAAAAAKEERQRIEQERAAIAARQQELEARAERQRQEFEAEKQQLLADNEHRRKEEEEQHRQRMQQRSAELMALEQEHQLRLEQLQTEIEQAEQRLSEEREQVFTRERVNEAVLRRESRDDGQLAEELRQQQEQLEAQRHQLEERIVELRAAQKRRLVTIACGVVVATVAAAVGGYFVKARIIDPAALPYRQAWAALGQQLETHREAEDWVELLNWSVSTDDRFTNEAHFADPDSGEVDRPMKQRFAEFYRDKRGSVVAEAQRSIDGILQQWDTGSLADEIDEARLLASLNAVSDWGLPPGYLLLRAKLTMPPARARGDYQAALTACRNALAAESEFADELAGELQSTVDAAIESLRRQQAADRPETLLALVREFPSVGWTTAPRLGLLAVELEAETLRRTDSPAAALAVLLKAAAEEPDWAAELTPVMDHTAATAARHNAGEIQTTLRFLAEEVRRRPAAGEVLTARVTALAGALAERPDSTPPDVLGQLVALVELDPCWIEPLAGVAAGVIDRLAAVQQQVGADGIRSMQAVLIRSGDIWQLALPFRLLAEVQADHQQRFDLYRRAAELGDIPSIGQVGRFHIGYGVENQAPEHVEEGLRLLTVAAEQDDANALFRLGEVYFAGLGVAADALTAIDFAERARAVGHPDALLLLGKAHLRQAELTRDADAYAEAGETLREAAEGGFAEAHYFRYISLWNDVVNDAEQAAAVLREGSARGNADCQHALGLWLEQGNPPVEQNLTNAREQMLAAARQGHANARQWCRQQAERIMTSGSDSEREWVRENEAVWR